MTLYSVPPDLNEPISFGTALPVTIGTPGQNATLTFSGSSGQRISLQLTSDTITYSYVSIKNPDGSNLVAPTLFNSNGGFIDVQTLAQTGTYAVFLNPQNAYIGNMTLTLYNVPADVSGSVTIGGSGVPVAITTPGQNGALTMAGTSGQQITVRLTSNSIGLVTVSLLNPSGATITSSTSSSSSFNLTSQTLGSTGNYSITINPSQANSGSITVTVTTP